MGNGCPGLSPVNYTFLDAKIFFLAGPSLLHKQLWGICSVRVPGIGFLG